jgi:hypothetical protein
VSMRSAPTSTDAPCFPMCFVTTVDISTTGFGPPHVTVFAMPSLAVVTENVPSLERLRDNKPPPASGTLTVQWPRSWSAHVMYLILHQGLRNDLAGS